MYFFHRKREYFLAEKLSSGVAMAGCSRAFGKILCESSVPEVQLNVKFLSQQIIQKFSQMIIKLQNLAFGSFNSCLHHDDKFSNLFKALIVCFDSIKKKTTSHGYLVNSEMLFCFGTQAPLESCSRKKKLRKCWHPSDRIGNATCKQPYTRRANTNFIHGDKTTFLSLSPARVAYFIRFPCRNDGLSKSVKEARNAEIISLGIKCNLHIKSSVAFN